MGVPQQSPASPIAESAKSFPHPDLPFVARHAAARAHAVSQVIDYVAKAAAQHPYKVAIVAGERAIYFGQLPFLAAAAANRLNLADPGSGPIAILVPDSIDWIIAHLGARQLGRTTVSVCTNVNADDLARCLEAMGVTAALTSSGIEPLSTTKSRDIAADALVHIIADDCGQIEVTSFSEAEIFRLGRNMPKECNAENRADILLPATIAEFYANIGQSKTDVLENSMLKHISRRWKEMIHEPAEKQFVQ